MSGFSASYECPNAKYISLLPAVIRLGDSSYVWDSVYTTAKKLCLGQCVYHRQEIVVRSYVWDSVYTTAKKLW